MAKNTFATFGILAVLLLSLGLVSAASGTETLNGITLTVDETTLADVSAGETYDFEVTIASTNETSYNVSFGVSSWSWNDSNVIIANGETKAFVGTLTITSAQTKNVIAKFHNMSNSSQELFSISLPISLSYVVVPGCTDPAANNYDPDATENDDSCTYPTPDATTFCELESHTELGQLEISDFDVRNNGKGSDDEWEFLDQIEITVEVENTGNDKVEDVEVTILILDNKIEDGGNDVTSDFDFDRKTIKSIGKLRDDDTEEVVFTIDKLPSDLDDGTYYMYIMAYEDRNEDLQCTSEIDSRNSYFQFSVESVDYEDSIVARGTGLESRIDTYCGQENIEITVPIYNLGEDEEEKVLVNLYSSAMGIDQYEVIDDLDNGDKEVITFFINIPSNLPNERYTLDILTSFDWDDEKDDEDETSYDEQTSESIRLNILACAAPAPSIVASLESTTKVGQDLVIKAIITNNGKLNTFVVTPTGFEAWAELVSVNPSTIEIASGNSQEITITLSPTKSGEQSFMITTIADGETSNQLVSVNIAEKSRIISGMSNPILYLTLAIAALLLIIFLVLIVKVSRRPAPAASF